MTDQPPPPPEPEKKRELKDGRFVLLRLLGEGSQGETYEAIDKGVGIGGKQKDSRSLVEEWDRYVRRAGEKASSPPIPRDSQLVAIKCFRVNKAKAWKDVELAEREARTLASLDHPNLPKYIEHFELDGALYLVMEKIEGESLATLRKNGKRWTHEEVTRMLEDLAKALRYLHGRSPFIVHRDIKPGNVIRRLDGSFALVDFGAVRDRLKLGGGSTIVGTFGYMAPEQFQGRASPKSDLYGVAATALVMLTGEEPEDLPHEGLGIDVARAVPRGTPTPLVRALTAMLQPDPDRRVDSIDDALRFLHVDKDEKKEKKKSEPPPVSAKAQSRQERKAEEAARRDAKRARKEEERRERAERRAARRARALPLIPRLIGQIALLVAGIVVWVVVGIATPIVLGVLSLIFGSALRRAAKACVGAASRAQKAISRKAAWLGGTRDDEEAPPPVENENVAGGSHTSQAPRMRIPPLPEDRILASSDREASELQMRISEARDPDADEWLEERLARDAAREEQRAFEQRLRRQPQPQSIQPPRRGVRQK